MNRDAALEHLLQSRMRGFVRTWPLVHHESRFHHYHLVGVQRHRDLVQHRHRCAAALDVAAHDKEPFVPFGKVIEGMDVADALNAEYGETAGGGIRAGKQAPLFEGGNDWLKQNFPRLDYIIRALEKDGRPKRTPKFHGPYGFNPARSDDPGVMPMVQTGND